MKLKIILATTFFSLVSLTFLASGVQAVTTPTLNVIPTTGDAVQVTATADANSSLQLSFLPPGALQVTSLSFGTTDANGRLATTISSGGYGIPAGSPVYVSSNGLTSATLIWPTYTSALTLSPSTVQVATGQTVTVSGSSALSLVANSNPTGIGASITSGQLRITGLTNGAGNVIVCSANVGCATLLVTVGSQNQSSVSLSQTSVSLSSRQTQEVRIFGPSGGFTVSSNSNPSAVTPSISGLSSSLILYGNDTVGTATIVVCSIASTSNCATLTVTVSGTTTNSLTFSSNNLALTPGQTQFTTVTGGPDNNYYISGNSNAATVQPSISGNTITLVGGTASGTAVITVCSASVNATCSNLYTTTNPTGSNTSGSLLSFSQNVVSVATGQTATVTVSGGTGTGYVISSNTNSSVITANSSSGSNTITLYANATSGSSIITICATAPATACGSIYVTATATQVPLSFSQNNLVLKPGQGINLIVSGGQPGVNYLISSNSSPSVVSATIGSGNAVIALKGGASLGSAVITVCTSNDSTNCGSLYVSNANPVSTSPITPTNPAPTTPAPTTPVVSSFKFTKFLAIGSVGTEVRELQKLLVKEGLLKVSPTGNFGSLTQAAVKAFQKKYKIQTVGYVGPATRVQLNLVASQR